MSFAGHQVSWQAFFPNLTTPSSTLEVATVGSGFEFTNTERHELPGASLVNTDIDISGTRIHYEIDDSAWVFSTTPGFNGIRIADFDGSIDPIIAVQIISGAKPLAITPANIFFSQNAIYIDVDGLLFSRGSTIDLEITFGTPGSVGPGVPADIAAVARLYEAAFGRVPDEGGVNYWIDVMQNGRGLDSIAAYFLDSPEFSQIFGEQGNLTDRQLVDTLYQNILSRPGEQAGVDFWTTQLATDAMTREHVLVQFAVSAENVAGTGYINDMAHNITGLDWIIG